MTRHRAAGRRGGRSPSTGPRRSVWARRCGPGCRSRRASRCPGQRSMRSRPATPGATAALREAVRVAADAACRALLGRRRGLRRGQLRRSAPDRPQRADRPRTSRGGAGDLVVGQLRLGHHLPQAARRVRAAECRRGRAVAAAPDTAGRDVHPQPDHRRGRADDRGELGSGRGGGRPGRVIPDSFRVARGGEVLERTPGFKKIAIRAAAGRRHRRRRRPRRAAGGAVPERRAAAGTVRRWPTPASGSTARGATSSGPSPTVSSTCCSAGRSPSPPAAAPTGPPAAPPVVGRIDRPRAAVLRSRRAPIATPSRGCSPSGSSPARPVTRRVPRPRRSTSSTRAPRR